MLVGVVDEVGPSASLGLEPGRRIATLVSLTLTPVVLTDELAGWDGLGEQAPAAGHAILFGMRPQYRAQSYLTFKLFFNSLLYP